MITKIINNNISEAIGEYIDRVHEKKNWVLNKHGQHFLYGDKEHLSAVNSLRKQLLLIRVRADILDETTLNRIFVCMETEGTATWFKNFMLMFGKQYYLEPHCNLATMKYKIKMVWTRQLN